MSPSRGSVLSFCSSCHIPPCRQLAEILSCEPWPGAIYSCALRAQHSQSSTGTFFSKGGLAHCSWQEWPLPPDREERKSDSCVAPQVIWHCLVARLLQESKEIQTQTTSLGWDRDTWTQLKVFCITRCTQKLCLRHYTCKTWSHGRVSFTESTLMTSAWHFIPNHEPVTRSKVAAHLVLRGRLGWAPAYGERGAFTHRRGYACSVWACNPPVPPIRTTTPHS